MKWAVTFFAADIDKVQVLRPLQSPDHPMNTFPATGETVSVTLVPFANDVLQVLPQFTPVGLLLIVPIPVPFLVAART